MYEQFFGREPKPEPDLVKKIFVCARIRRKNNPMVSTFQPGKNMSFHRIFYSSTRTTLILSLMEKIRSSLILLLSFSPSFLSFFLFFLFFLFFSVSLSSRINTQSLAMNAYYFEHSINSKYLYSPSLYSFTILLLSSKRSTTQPD